MENEELSYLIDAKIIAVEPGSNSYGVILKRTIGEIIIETTDGRKLLIIAGGYDDDRYMEVDEEEEMGKRGER